MRQLAGYFDLPENGENSFDKGAVAEHFEMLHFRKGTLQEVPADLADVREMISKLDAAFAPFVDLGHTGSVGADVRRSRAVSTLSVGADGARVTPREVFFFPETPRSPTERPQQDCRNQDRRPGLLFKKSTDEEPLCSEGPGARSDGEASVASLDSTTVSSASKTARSGPDSHKATAGEPTSSASSSRSHSSGAASLASSVSGDDEIASVSDVDAGSHDFDADSDDPEEDYLPTRSVSSEQERIHRSLQERIRGQYRRRTDGVPGVRLPGSAAAGACGGAGTGPCATAPEPAVSIHNTVPPRAVADLLQGVEVSVPMTAPLPKLRALWSLWGLLLALGNQLNAGKRTPADGYSLKVFTLFSSLILIQSQSHSLY